VISGLQIGVPQKTGRHVPGRWRVVALLTIAALLAGIVWSRLVFWQVLQHSTLAAAAQEQYRELVELPAVRGVIFDRNMKPLVVNTTVYSAFVSPDQIPDDQRARVALALGQVLGADAGKVNQILSSGAKFAYIARRFSKQKADQLRSMLLPGVGLEEEQQRAYLPGTENSSLAANLLGFVNFDGQGQYGVEGYDNKQLSGTPGYLSSYRDLANNQIVLGSQKNQNPVNGSDLVLTIDSDVQYAAEQALAAGVHRDRAESGSVLIMDPSTGGIVAWADYPSYNANNFNQLASSQFLDNISSSVYEPGSVMKVVTLSGAIDAGKITPDQVINDPGYVYVGGYRIYDWDRRNHGNVTYTYVLEHSLNVGAMKAMLAEGHASFYNYLQAFGFTKPSGVDVAGESTVAPPSASTMQDSQYATSAFGQGIDVNMVQMLSAINVIANGGRYAQPHVVERIGNSLNPLELQPQRQVISAQTAAEMTAMMEQVVQNGSGWSSRVHGFELDQAGKTGTSQMPINGKYTLNVWASFVGFLPAKHPRFTMLVVIRKPNYPGSNEDWTLNDGYLTAAPIWQRIAQSLVVDWRITPDPR
jgi:stage V sporulation protein D (sporulation-specific penicillin-binding protein)